MIYVDYYDLIEKLIFNDCQKELVVLRAFKWAICFNDRSFLIHLAKVSLGINLARTNWISLYFH